MEQCKIKAFEIESTEILIKTRLKYNNFEFRTSCGIYPIVEK